MLQEKIRLRGWSDKDLASLPDSATIAREMHYSVVPCCRRLLTKFQPDRTSSSGLRACESKRVRRFFLKNGKEATSFGDSILVFGREITQ
ncbi:hypothetical protein TNCT_598131 [Trichonephila clavata]|uniref:Uncharacterized protein n=1 Tax=Trichonephila clavata TaxID=2740835 RepID=A0A8X6I1B5_TRICU|nr:hypothetical protein TNCT_598131 [Trichonephila clavata]